MNALMMMMGGGGEAGSSYLTNANFAASSSLPAGYALTSDAGYRLNSSGEWDSVSSGSIRQHHTSGGTSMGSLLTPAYSNYFTQSNSLAHADWLVNGLTATANEGTDIFGNNDAAELVTSGGNQRIFQYFSSYYRCYLYCFYLGETSKWCSYF